jgi:hypothetical protein
MAKPMKSFPYLLLIAVCAVSFACGGGNASMTGASETQASPGKSAQSVQGATIQGTLRSSAAAGDVNASSEVGAASMGGIKVSIVGTSIQVSTDGNGQFTLTGIPAGSAELRFQGRGLDATLTIGGLVAGQTLTLTFQVNGNSVSKVGDDDGQHGDDDQGDDDNHGQNQVELDGTISSLSPLTIAGRHVTTSSSTRYFGAHHASVPASDVLKLGNKVEVEGQQQADKTVLASKIQLED